MNSINALSGPTRTVNRNSVYKDVLNMYEPQRNSLIVTS